MSYYTDLDRDLGAEEEAKEYMEDNQNNIKEQIKLNKAEKDIEKESRNYLRVKEASSYFNKLKRKIKKSLVKLSKDNNVKKVETDDIKFKFNKEKRTYYSKSKLKNALSDYLAEDEIEAALDSVEKTEIKKVYVNSNSPEQDLYLAQYIEKIKKAM